jgi:hypothetical protein
MKQFIGRKILYNLQIYSLEGDENGFTTAVAHASLGALAHESNCLLVRYFLIVPRAEMT